MKYAKPALTIEQQVQLLQSRGLVGDPARMASRLREVSYYRLAGYTFPFRDSNDMFQAGTSFDLVWDHYVFDRQLRLLVLDAIERVEVSVRTRLAYELAHRRGPFALWDTASTLSMPPTDRIDLLAKVREEVRRNEKEAFLQHFFQKYGDVHTDPPIWMLAEVLSFGVVVRLVDKIERPVRDSITRAYGVPDTVLISWLRALNFVRNVCAHHGRLWNRVLSYRVLLPNDRKYPAWHRPVLIPNDRLFTIATLLHHLLRVVSPGSTWGTRFLGLLAAHPFVSAHAMGFPEDWMKSPLWKGATDEAK
jgi:abortive infection bacteriophage resistance protein